MRRLVHRRSPLLPNTVSRVYHVNRPTFDAKATTPEAWTKLATKELKDTPLDKIYRKNADVRH
jgi:hypothetical protein